jgi:hypothetical protein
MKEKKVYLLTEEKMQELTADLCVISKCLAPANEKRFVSKTINKLAQLPSVSSKDKFDVLIDKIVKAMGLRKEGQQ